jgi:hypothetical protein
VRWPLALVVNILHFPISWAMQQERFLKKVTETVGFTPLRSLLKKVSVTFARPKTQTSALRTFTLPLFLLFHPKAPKIQVKSTLPD